LTSLNLRRLPELEYRSAAGSVFAVSYWGNPVGKGMFVSVSIVEKDWTRISGPWDTVQQAEMAVELALGVAEELVGVKTAKVRGDVAKLRQLKESGAKFLPTLDGERWAIVWFKPPKPGLADTELRYDTREQAEEAMRMAQ